MQSTCRGAFPWPGMQYRVKAKDMVHGRSRGQHCINSGVGRQGEAAIPIVSIAGSLCYRIDTSGLLPWPVAFSAVHWRNRPDIRDGRYRLAGCDSSHSSSLQGVAADFVKRHRAWSPTISSLRDSACAVGYRFGSQDQFSGRHECAISRISCFLSCNWLSGGSGITRSTACTAD
jgi:hypothetical protein